MEVVVASLIATVAVVGLAYTFGMGRGFIDRYETGRAAMAIAEGQLDRIAVTGSNDTLVTPVDAPLTPIDGLHKHMSYFSAGGPPLGTLYWTLQWFDDPADGTGTDDPDPDDLRQATVTAVFRQGSMTDSVSVSRLLPAVQ